jgi:hypothetical protein
MEADALPGGLIDYVDVYYTIDKLSCRDIKNYLVHNLPIATPRAMIVDERMAIIKVPGCSSLF